MEDKDTKQDGVYKKVEKIIKGVVDNVDLNIHQDWEEMWDDSYDKLGEIVKKEVVTKQLSKLIDNHLSDGFFCKLNLLYDYCGKKAVSDSLGKVMIKKLLEWKEKYD